MLRSGLFGKRKEAPEPIEKSTITTGLFNQLNTHNFITMFKTSVNLCELGISLLKYENSNIENIDTIRLNLFVITSNVVFSIE